jgi:hypothetical protein
MKIKVDKCTHENTRWLDCEECKEMGEVCPLLICCACGETIEE